MEPRHRFYTEEIAFVFLFTHKNVGSTDCVPRIYCRVLNSDMFDHCTSLDNNTENLYVTRTCNLIQLF